MIKDFAYLIAVIILIFGLASMLIHTDFTCSAYNIEYKDICLHLLEE